MAQGLGKREEREKRWRRIVEGQAVSGLSIREWCRRQGVTEASFFVWRRKIVAGGNKQRSSSKEGPQLLAVEVAPENFRGQPLQLFVSDVRIEVKPGFDARALERLLALVREPAAC